MEASQNDQDRIRKLYGYIMTKGHWVHQKENKRDQMMGMDRLCGCRQ